MIFPRFSRIKFQNLNFINAAETVDEISKIEAEENNFLNRTQYFILVLNSLSIYKNDVYYNASIDCFFEQLIASKVLLIKEPLEQLDECKNESCYRDVKIEMDLTVEEIAEQMKMCLDHAKAIGPLYIELLKAVQYLHERSTKTIDELIEQLKSNQSSTIRGLLHKIISIEQKLGEGQSVIVKKKDKNIANFAKQLTDAP